MKTSVKIKAIVTVAVFFISHLIYSNGISNNLKDPSKDTSMCLILKGKVAKSTGSSGQIYTIQLVDNNRVIKSKTLKAGSKFEFELQKNRWYAVKIIREGCMSKLISVTTHNVPDLNEEDMYVVNFDLADPLSSDEAKYLDRDAVDFPLAIIAYNKSADTFDYIEEYTSNIKKTLITDIGYHAD